MIGKTARISIVLGSSLVLASPASAQLPLSLSANGGAASTQLNTGTTGATERLSGFSAGGGATVAYRRLGMSFRYLEGSVSPRGGGTGRDIVEGEAMLSLRGLSWLSVSFGRHIRSYVRSDGTERWLLWEARIRTEARLATRRLISSLEASQVLSADVNSPEAFDRAQGIEGELKWMVFSRPLWLSLGYRMDRARLGGGSRTEVLEHIRLTVGFGQGTTN